MATTTEVLRSIPLIQGMTDTAIEAIADLAEVASLPTGSELTLEVNQGSRSS